ncbi:ATP synthase subunit I [Paenibacillus sp. GCM10023252]|uniref:ATP synthase subunit I n=1 Tax=Paenibacillus sp. GCM10023252 TaxID=3252649 RepID=UPI00360ECACC
MDNIMKTAMQAVLAIVTACLLLWALLPDLRTVAAGIIVGLAASSMNALLLRRRAEMVGHAAAGQGKRRMGLGLGSRIAMILLATMVAYKNPETLHLPSVLAASIVVPLLVLASAYYHNSRQS